MDVNYEIKNCSHCNSNDVTTLGNENQIYGLVVIEPNNNGEMCPNINHFLPVIATVCKNCGHVDLVHINAKAIEK